MVLAQQLLLSRELEKPNFLGRNTVTIDLKKSNTSMRPPVNLKGVIVPIDWDEIGNFTAIALAADDQEEYLISAKNKFGRLLHQLLRTRVKIEGYISTEAYAGNRKVIIVNSYQVLEEILP
jgi:hypothetical protein